MTHEEAMAKATDAWNGEDTEDSITNDSETLTIRLDNACRAYYRSMQAAILGYSPMGIAPVDGTPILAFTWEYDGWQSIKWLGGRWVSTLDHSYFPEPYCWTSLPDALGKTLISIMNSYNKEPPPMPTDALVINADEYQALLDYHTNAKYKCADDEDYNGADYHKKRLSQIHTYLADVKANKG